MCSQASTGWSGISIPQTLRPGTSPWVRTARTPDIASASEVSMDQIRARGCGLLRVAPHNMPSIHRSEEYSNSPLTLGTPSERVVCSPTLPGAETGARGRLRVGVVCAGVIRLSPFERLIFQLLKASGIRFQFLLMPLLR